MRGARLQCVKTMGKLIVGILLVLAKITFIGFDLIFALRWLLNLLLKRLSSLVRVPLDTSGFQTLQVVQIWETGSFKFPDTVICWLVLGLWQHQATDYLNQAGHKNRTFWCTLRLHVFLIQLPAYSVLRIIGSGDHLHSISLQEQISPGMARVVVSGYLNPTNSLVTAAEKLINNF